MNKIGKAMLCTVLTGAMAVGAAGAADLGTLTPQGAKAYLEPDRHAAKPVRQGCRAYRRRLQADC